MADRSGWERLPKDERTRVLGRLAGGKPAGKGKDKKREKPEVGEILISEREKNQGGDLKNMDKKKRNRG